MTGLLLSALALTVVSLSAGGGGLGGPVLAHRGVTVGHIAGGSGSTAEVPGAAAAGTALATFGQPTISGIQGNGFEQDIRVDSKDRVYTSVPGALSSGTSWIWRSLDHGKTFKWIPAAEPKSGKLPTCVGGGDTELAVDSADHLYFNDLTLANFSTGRSDDQGRTFTPPNCTSVDTTPDDRQWYATDGDPTTGVGSLYLTYDIVGFGPPECSGSVGNNTVVMARSPAGGVGPDAGVHFSPAQFVSDPTACDEGIMGNNEVSPVSHKVFVIHDNAAFDAILVGRCRPVPYTDDPSGLKCVDLPVASFPGFRTGGDFPTMAIDRAGNLFAVWEQAPKNAGGDITGDTLLYFSSSTDEGNHWTAPVQIPTPGLHNNVFAWTVAGDAGRAAIAWYGTAATDPGGGCTGPDGVNGLWNLYFTQSLNATAAVPTFTTPVAVVNHFIHKGSIQTVVGHQCGDRTLGDFLQMRLGKDGEANISFADSNNIDEPFAPHAMFVRQNGGHSLFASGGMVHGAQAPKESVKDASGDGRFEALGVTSSNQPNLDILSSTITRPDATHYQVKMQVADLTSLAPDPSTGNTDQVLVWQTQWLVPSPTNAEGGKNFMVYMESQDGGQPTFWVGENAAEVQGGGVTLTYPGDHEVTGSYTATTPGTITINVPIADVTVAGAAPGVLNSVTASTMTLDQPPESAPSLGGIGGVPFTLIDVAPGYDAHPKQSGGGGGLQCTIRGTSGPDTLNGTSAPDVICGFAGADAINGMGGNDVLSGGKGPDHVVGGAGSDRLKGGYGADRLNSQDGVEGNDRNDGGRGTDACVRDPGDTATNCET
jgi:hypothetical protein